MRVSRDERGLVAGGAAQHEVGGRHERGGLQTRQRRRVPSAALQRVTNEETDGPRERLRGLLSLLLLCRSSAVHRCVVVAFLDSILLLALFVLLLAPVVVVRLGNLSEIDRHRISVCNSNKQRKNANDEHATRVYSSESRMSRRS